MRLRESTITRIVWRVRDAHNLLADIDARIIWKLNRKTSTPASFLCDSNAE